MVPGRRYAAVVTLLVAGLLLSASVGTATSLRTEYVAREVDPAASPTAVADVDPDVVNLDSRLADDSAAVREPVDTAARTGRFEGSVPPELHIQLDGMDARYAVYDGQYYRLDLNVSEETTRATIRLDPTAGAAVAEAVATPYASASSDVQRVVREGSMRSEAFVEPGLVVRDGTYYLVRTRAEGALAGRLLAAFGGFVLAPVGRAYVVAALGLLAALRSRDTSKPLDERVALGVVVGTLLVSWTFTALVGSGSLAMRFTLVPFVGGVAALGLFAGSCLRTGAWGRLAATSVLAAVVGVGTPLVAVGGFAGAIAVPLLVVGWLGSLPLATYGYRFTPE
ncbi:hypothetical protein C2R22_16230 [Salinigranum rubrum]|uniref:Uncharacterized protein n=1 Tax=Salinigranum rubrum TaxID=755307 RepID=A0A2I8VM47_9EURY|nr:hypothetical protein [Salinigranum rubrum]AUV83000.1 hypothetical protein C2R22_16230 [Salinigranum rubrum]